MAPCLASRAAARRTSTWRSLAAPGSSPAAATSPPWCIRTDDMNEPLRVVLYLNQFFGQVGGEEAAGVGPRWVAEPVGPGRALAPMLGADGVLVGTVVCGDNYFAEQ